MVSIEFAMELVYFIYAFLLTLFYPDVHILVRTCALVAFWTVVHFDKNFGRYARLGIQLG